jgi:gas vesicle protein
MLSSEKLFTHQGAVTTPEGEVTMANPTNVGSGRDTVTPKLDTTHELPASTGASGLGASTGSSGLGANLQQAKDQGKNLAQDTKDQAKDVAQGAKEQVKSLASDAKDQAKDVANQARDHVQQLVGQQKDQAADRLGSLAEALREAGRKLNEGQQAGDFGHYADRAAGQVERLSKYLRENDLSGFVRDTESFARRRPEVFLGGTLIAGLMLARFLKASTPDQGRSSGYDGGLRTGYPQPARRTSQGLSSQGQSPSRSSYASQPRNLGQGNLGQGNVGQASRTSPGTTPYNPPKTPAGA